MASSNASQPLSAFADFFSMLRGLAELAAKSLRDRRTVSGAFLPFD